MYIRLARILRLSQSRSLLIEWTWHERLLSLAIAYGLQKVKYRDIREHQGKVIESYCCGKDVFLSAPTGSALSISLCPCLVIHRETLANWASPFGLF